MKVKPSGIRDFLVYAIPVMFVDLVIHVMIFKWISSVFRYVDPADLVMCKKKVVYFLIVSFLLTMAIVPVKFYKRGVDIRITLLRAFLQTLMTLSLFAISVFVLFDSFAGKLYLQEGITATIAICAWHILSRLLIFAMRRKHKLNTVIVGAGANAIHLYDTLTNWNYYSEHKVLGFFSPENDGIPEVADYLGDYSDVVDYLEKNDVRVVYCSINPATTPDIINRIIRVCENSFIEFFYVPNMEGYLHHTMAYSEIGHVLVFQLREEPLSNPVNAAIKRLFDILISALFLVTIYPFVWVFVAIGTSLSSPGPIIFRQKRTGYKGNSFTMLKFRSMKVNDDADKIQATEDDPRKTTFGDFLRRTSIDELPQFINVLKGDMSLIGPRPHMELHTVMYNKLVDEYMVRHMVKPGLTGWAQVNGCRGETKEVEQMARRVKYDIWYVEHWSLALDIKIFLLTVLQILRGDEQAY